VFDNRTKGAWAIRLGGKRGDGWGFTYEFVMILQRFNNKLLIRWRIHGDLWRSDGTPSSQRGIRRVFHRTVEQLLGQPVSIGRSQRSGQSHVGERESDSYCVPDRPESLIHEPFELLSFCSASPRSLYSMALRTGQIKSKS